MEAEGYWYKQGVLFDIRPQKHIHYICQNPVLFGFSKEGIDHYYKQYGEKPRFEGKAREVIIQKATESGWIRIRHYARPDYWSMQFFDYDKRIIEVYSITKYLLDEKIMHKADALSLTDFATGVVRQYGYSDGGVALFVEEYSVFNKESLCIVMRCSKNLLAPQKPESL
jgi:hypothetical protein